MTSITVPVKFMDGQSWLIFRHLSDAGTLRAAKIIVAKHPVPDWDGHHCDEAQAKESIRFSPKKYVIL